jgi:hypothetical protein
MTEPQFEFRPRDYKPVVFPLWLRVFAPWKLKRGRKFSHTKIVIDGLHFDGCDFRNCVIEYRGGPIHLTNSQFIECTYALSGAAARTMTYLRNIFATSPQVFRATFPQEILAMLQADKEAACDLKTLQ